MVAYLFQEVSYSRMKLENAQEYFLSSLWSSWVYTWKKGMHARILVLKDGYRGLWRKKLEINGQSFLDCVNGLIEASVNNFFLKIFWHFFEKKIFWQCFVFFTVLSHFFSFQACLVCFLTFCNNFFFFFCLFCSLTMLFNVSLLFNTTFFYRVVKITNVSNPITINCIIVNAGIWRSSTDQRVDTWQWTSSRNLVFQTRSSPRMWYCDV